jgi:hypothetical protein
MTRHDPLVHTAALRHRPTGRFAPSAAATSVTHAELVNTAAADARVQPGGRLLAGLATPYASALGTHPTTPNRKTP